MATEVDREGSFKARIIDYGLKKADSGAIGITLKVALMAMFNPESEDWDPWSEYDMEAWGDIWVVKKDGKLNEAAVKSLIANAGWDGYLESISGRTWNPTDCQVRIGENTYKDKTSYRISFVNALDSVPGQMASIEPEEVKSLDSMYGSSLRALAGTVKSNAKAPNGKPPAPPRRPAPAPVVAGEAGDDEPLPEFRG